jgi:hypothetical protein
MRILAALALAAAVLAAPAQAQPAPPPAPAPGITLSVAELDALIQSLADTPARYSFGALQMLLAKRQQATEAKAP